MSAAFTFDELLSLALAQEASDIHLREDDELQIRNRKGDMTRLNVVVPVAAVDEFVRERMTPRQAATLQEIGQADFAYVNPQGQRFRVNIFRERGKRVLVLRVIRSQIRTCEELGVAPQITSLVSASEGLILVTGPTGSGKSTTLAALIQKLNMEEALNIITIEEPIEMVYPPGRGMISQREVGTDTADFMGAVRASLRQDPDVVLIGEMRDRETADAALSLAGTGHLVFSTLHTQDSVRTLTRVMEFYSHDARPGVQAQMANVLRGVVSQRLLPTADPNGGRALATELMVCTGRVSEALAQGALDKVREAVHEAGQRGDAREMWTFDQDLVRLVLAGELTRETAMSAAIRPGDVHTALSAARGLL